MLIILTTLSYAAITEDHVIINSKDWKDVYSSVIYSNINGKKSNFILSQSYAPIILNTVPRILSSCNKF